MIGTLKDISKRQGAQESVERSVRELRQLAAFLNETAEKERCHIAHEIHDEVWQVLAALKMDLVLLRKRLRLDDPLESEIMGRLLGSVNGALEAMQHILGELRPPVLDDLGLLAAVDWQVTQFQKTSGVPCRLFVPHGEIGIDAATATALFRILQQTLLHLGTHCRASQLTVIVRAGSRFVQLMVQSRGEGYRTCCLHGGCRMVLVEMRERARAFGGQLRFTDRGEGWATLDVRLTTKPKRGMGLADADTAGR